MEYTQDQVELSDLPLEVVRRLSEIIITGPTSAPAPKSPRKVDDARGIAEGLRLRGMLLISAVLGWPLLIVALLLTHRVSLHPLPLLVISAPLWVPMLSMAALLLAAMWIDKLSSRLNDQ
jgi:hypothetical protein